ncbi:hypothetical protein V8C26DRAFT_12028 [Trichoderma gracile]
MLQLPCICDAQSDEWDRRLGLPRENATYICVRNHPESPSQIRHTFLPSRWSHKESWPREGTRRRGGGATGGLPWPSLALFFFLLRDTLPFTCAGVCVRACVCGALCVPRAAEGSGSSTTASSSQHETVSLLHAYMARPSAGKARVGRIFCSRNGGL